VKKLIAITLGLCATGCVCQAQDLSGFWKGSLSMKGCFPENNIELQVKMNDESASGDSYHYQDVNNYVKKNFSGRYNASEKKLFVQEGLVTTYHIPYSCVICIKHFELSYSVNGNIETLSGSWNGHVQHTEAGCSGGTIILTRMKESAFKEIPEIKVDTGTIRLDFYDNAEIDGDTITVKVNNTVVLSGQRLGIKPLTAFIRVDANQPFHEVEMIAENLGSIPPNTAVLVITAGENYYRLSLSSSDAKSARIRVIYKNSGAENIERKISFID